VILQVTRQQWFMVCPQFWCPSGQLLINRAHQHGHFQLLEASELDRKLSPNQSFENDKAKIKSGE
jgi:hypothetical protein